jgi:hypothetical protein
MNGQTSTGVPNNHNNRMGKQTVHSTYANILKNKYTKVRKNVGIG